VAVQNRAKKYLKEKQCSRPNAQDVEEFWKKTLAGVEKWEDFFGQYLKKQTFLEVLRTEKDKAISQSKNICWTICGGRNYFSWKVKRIQAAEEDVTREQETLKDSIGDGEILEDIFHALQEIDEIMRPLASGAWDDEMKTRYNQHFQVRTRDANLVREEAKEYFRGLEKKWHRPYCLVNMDSCKKLIGGCLFGWTQIMHGRRIDEKGK